MPAMNMNEPQPQAPPMPAPQQPMGQPDFQPGDSPFGPAGGPHGQPGQPSLEEILGREQGLTPGYMRWQ